MRKPYIQSLHYEAKSSPEIIYRDPKPVSFSNNIGDFKLEDGKLDIFPYNYFSDEDGARKVIEPFLRSWEIEADLNTHLGMIRFNFDCAIVIDLSPSPNDPLKVQHDKSKTYNSTFTADAFLIYESTKYPKPPNTFYSTYDVEIGYQRWKNFREGKEPLQSMAYFVLTLIEKNGGSRKKAAQKYQIDFLVLDNIGRLSTIKGDGKTARKVLESNQFQPLSDSEKQWLEEAIRRIIYRLGEYASGGPINTLSMRDLPNL